jgi:hypothetical protein
MMRNPKPRVSVSRWSEQKHRHETAEGHVDRLERRALLEQLRLEAETVERDGREYRLVHLPPAPSPRY